jgi:hypothetical protein
VSPRRACDVCGRWFNHAVRLPHPRTCGRIFCRSVDQWGPAEWEGQRRMARARIAAGVDLNNLDRAALQREAA